MPASLKTCILSLCAALILTACAEQATPIPAVLPSTITPESPVIEALDTVQYGILREALPFVPTTQSALMTDYRIIERPLAASEANGFDLITGIGAHPEWQTNNQFLNFAILLDPMLAPLNDPAIHTLLVQGIDARLLSETFAALPGLLISAEQPAAAGSIRNQLAALGYPDGFDLVLAAPDLPISQSIMMQAGNLGLQLERRDWLNQQALESYRNHQAHLTLIYWVSTAEADAIFRSVADNNIIQLFRIPISYLAQPELTIGTNEDGWPVIIR